MKKLLKTKQSKEERRAKQRARHLWECFRITCEERERIETFQRNHPIYKMLLGSKHGTDHSHLSGEVRGILEWRINRAYGLLERACPKNLPEVLRALALFHEQPPAELALGCKKYGLIGQARHKKRMVYGPPVEKGKGKKSKT